ncbi:hypothetical protein HAX54_033392 [Datura stramonium]|uniref:Uncharacterized protein n=1 Tax=Datura stramonium TaxID=4076 RepID=A0ABS8SD99_DATST|nr:hypothetical protein [Datura stramonium]
MSFSKSSSELNQMVNFKDYTSPSSKLKYLIIESSERPAMQTRLLVQTLLTGCWLISTKIPEVAHQECSNAVPQTGNSFTPLVMSSEQCKGKGPKLLKKTPTKQVYNQDCQVKWWRSITMRKVTEKWQRLALHDKDMESARKELSITSSERLSNAMLEEHEKIDKVSSIRQSLSKVKEKIEKLRRKEKDLEILLEAIEQEVEEAKLGVSTPEKDFDACNDADLLNFDDLTDLEQKKERSEAMRQDLINYKLCLD